MSFVRTAGALSAAIALVAIPAPGITAIDPIYGIDPELDAECDLLLNPDDNSGFVTFATNIQAGASTSVTVDDGAPTIAGIGAATTVLGNYRGAHVNGQSVNIHAYGDRVTSYAAGALKTQPTKTTVTTVRTATCHVHKLAAANASGNDGSHPGYNVGPRGLQNSVEASSTSVSYGVRTETLSGPYIDLANSIYGVEFVICNSPTKNPGVWRGQNGYVSQIDSKLCSTIWYQSLGSTPSGSVPAS